MDEHGPLIEDFWWFSYKKYYKSWLVIAIWTYQRMILGAWDLFLGCLYGCPKTCRSVPWHAARTGAQPPSGSQGPFFAVGFSADFSEIFDGPEDDFSMIFNRTLILRMSDDVWYAHQSSSMEICLFCCWMLLDSLHPRSFNVVNH